MKWFFLFSALTFATAPAHAGSSLRFAQNIYDALDLIDSQEFDKFHKAAEHLLFAKDFAFNEQAADELGNALKIIRKTKNPADPLDPAERSQIRTFLANALVSNRLKLNSSYLDEAKLMERMILVRYFGEEYDQVRISYENTTREKALALLLNYFIDPRSVKYDPQVQSLITGKNPDGSKGSSHVVFTLTPLEIEVPPGTDLNVLVKDFNNEAKELFGEYMPIRALLTDGGMVGRALVAFEVTGIEYIPQLQFAKMVLGLAPGNRWLQAIGDFFSAVASKNITGTGVVASLETLAQSGASAAERLLKNKITSTGWVEHSSTSVLESFQKTTINRIAKAEGVALTDETAMKAIRARVALMIPKEGAKGWVKGVTELPQFLPKMQARLVQLSEKFKDSKIQQAVLKGTAEDLSVLKAELAELSYLTRVKATRAALDALFNGTPVPSDLGKVTFKSWGSFREVDLSRWVQSKLDKFKIGAKDIETSQGVHVLDDVSRRLTVSISGELVMTWDYAVRGVFGAVILYNFVHGTLQTVRAPDKMSAWELALKYYPAVLKDVAMLLNAHAFEVLFAIDIGSTVLQETLDLAFDIETTIPGSEGIIASLVQGARRAYFRLKGSSMFEETLKPLEKSLKTSLLYDVDGRTYDAALAKLKAQAADHKSGLMNEAEAIEARRTFRKNSGQMMLRYAALLYSLNDFLHNDYSAQLGIYEADLQRKLFSSPGSYMNTAKQILKAMPETPKEFAHLAGQDPSTVPDVEFPQPEPSPNGSEPVVIPSPVDLARSASKSSIELPATDESSVEFGAEPTIPSAPTPEPSPVISSAP